MGTGTFSGRSWDGENEHPQFPRRERDREAEQKCQLEMLLYLWPVTSPCSLSLLGTQLSLRGFPYRARPPILGGGSLPQCRGQEQS